MLLDQIELYNIQEAVKVGDGYRLSRVPAFVREGLNGHAALRAFNTCGSELRFRMVSDEVKVTLRREHADTATRNGVAEVFFGSFQAPYGITPQVISTEATTFVIKKPDHIDQLKLLAKNQSMRFDAELVRVLLPYDWECRYISIEGEVLPPLAEQSPTRKMLSYGSSITHGGDALGPSGTYAMRTAEKLGVDLISMGFAGSAHMDEAAARYIASREDWEFATFEMGINVFRIWEPEQFAEKVRSFVQAIAEQHRDRWLFFTDMFTCVHDAEDNPKAEQFRRIVQENVEQLGLPNAVYISGRKLLTSFAGLSADLIHPSAAGQEEISEHLTRHILQHIGG
ncbi:GDSL-like Lipase/Acylhydrolase family protein [Paenibacillus algorifonticola]|uniref:GDSL-like Lipase/Acylhydrolase family protein n=1 Tax=Paenibacillus algorifonticola TaxID=684063 RepID=A0A1I2BUE2_9BACL|nr:GDSL-type esterase/lipase family protein [Paenibacillus algorifonticola]SFE58930.1 GDSL-like Lipase/Acylhydrolase family protein [Paenibacillus algorifonticola]